VVGSRCGVLENLPFLLRWMSGHSGGRFGGIGMDRMGTNSCSLWVCGLVACVVRRFGFGGGGKNCRGKKKPPPFCRLSMRGNVGVQAVVVVGFGDHESVGFVDLPMRNEINGCVDGIGGFGDDRGLRNAFERRFGWRCLGWFVVSLGISSCC